MFGTCQSFCGTRTYKKFRPLASGLTHPESTYVCKAKCLFCLPSSLFLCHVLFLILMQSFVVISLSFYKYVLEQRCSCYPAQEQISWEYRIYGISVCFDLAQAQIKSLCWLSWDTFFLEKKRGQFWQVALGTATSTQDWWAVVLVLVFLCCLMMFEIRRILARISQLVMTSGQKLQVEHRSKCTQELSPGSAPNKPSIQALLLIGNACGAWGWPGLGCAASCAKEQCRISEKYNAPGNTGA